MIDVGGKADVPRRAVATGAIILRPETLAAIREGRIEKGDVLASARVAGLQAAKRVSDVLPHCHPIPLTGADVRLDIAADRLIATAEVSATYKTGVEMESLYACVVALLTAWDMVKKSEKDGNGQYPSTRIEDLHVVSKAKGV